MRHLGVMRGLFMVSGLVVLGRFAMVLGRVLVVVRGLVMMLVNVVIVHRSLLVQLRGEREASPGSMTHLRLFSCDFPSTGNARHARGHLAVTTKAG
jgi:hypothetical protein